MHIQCVFTLSRLYCLFSYICITFCIHLAFQLAWLSIKIIRVLYTNIDTQPQSAWVRIFVMLFRIIDHIVICFCNLYYCNYVALNSQVRSDLLCSIVTDSRAPAVGWQASYPSLLGFRVPALPLGLRKSGRGEEDSGEES